MKRSKVEGLEERIRRIESALHRPAKLRADGWEMIDLPTCMAINSTPGVSVAVVDQGEIAWTRAYGVKEAGKPGLVTAKTRFQAASISKPIAALTALTIVEEGRLDLNEDIRRFQTTWKLPANHDWIPKVTLRMLLSHSAGVNIDGFLGYARQVAVPSLVQVLKGEAPANSPAILVDTLPELHFRYSGGGFCIVQQLIEDITGKPFWQAAQERVLKPLGMNNSTYCYPLSPEEQEACAVGHRSDGNPMAGKWNTYPESAAAGLWTTPVDLAKMIVELEATLRGKGGKIISQAMVQQMLSAQIKARDIGLNGWEGLSFFLTGKKDDLYFGHSGSNEGYRCSLIARKGKGQAGIIMTNSDTGWQVRDTWMETIAVEYGWKEFAWQPPLENRSRAKNPTIYTGRYQWKGGPEVEVIVDQGQLRMKIDGQPALTLARRARHRFFLTQINAEITFLLEKGKSVGIVYRQNGESLKGWRKV